MIKQESLNKQKNILKNIDVGAYKVGASNFRSGKFFNYPGIVLGGISNKNIFFNKVPSHYDIAEIEIIIKVDELDLDNPKENKLDYYLGIECPKVGIENPKGDIKLCVEDNCSSGDLLIFSKLTDLNFENVELQIEENISHSGALKNLRFALHEIFLDSLKIIKSIIIFKIFKCYFNFFVIYHSNSPILYLKTNR
jgi:hypothetical protein